jgi:methylated-DNA-protein-cysteine methyltransferase-like protein
MVGWAMSAACGLPDIPAHRVLNHTGLLTGHNHFASPDTMRQLLENEGVKIKNNKAVDFEKLFWNPIIELEKLCKLESQN